MTLIIYFELHTDNTTQIQLTKYYDFAPGPLECAFGAGLKARNRT